jgi:hypothetical protein
VRLRIVDRSKSSLRVSRRRSRERTTYTRPDSPIRCASSPEIRLSRLLLRLSAASATGLAAACADEPDGREPTPARPSGSALWFTEEAARRGLLAANHCGHPTEKRYILEEIGQGCALFDMDGDGDLDAFLVDASGLLPPATLDGDWTSDGSGQCRLYENDGSGRFRDVTEGSGAGLRVFGQGVTAADPDGDGDLDLYVTCWGRNRLLRNEGGGRFTDVPDAAGAGDERWSVGSCFFDADADGDLDLYVGNYLAMARARDPDCWNKVDCPWFDLVAACGPKGMVPEPDSLFLNQGDGTFRDASGESGIRAVEPRYALGVVAFDFDSDGDQDVYVANDSRGNYLFENDGSGRFTEIADLAGCALSAAGLQQAGMGIACGDWDGDLDLDLHLTNFSHDDNTLYRNDGRGGFLDVTTRHGFGTIAFLALGWGTEFVDFDLDGALDLFVANGHVHVQADRRAPELSYRQQCRVYRNVDGLLGDATGEAGPGLARRSSFRGAAFGDVDGDGDEDVLVAAQNEPPALFVNHSPTVDCHRLVLELEQPGMNRFAIGARVVARVGGRSLLRTVRAGGSFSSSSGAALHFGLGAAAVVDRLEVTWPDGEVQAVESVAADRKLRWRKGEAPAPRQP